MQGQVHEAAAAFQIPDHILELAAIWVITVPSAEPGPSAEVICPTQHQTKHGAQSQQPQPDDD